MLFVLLSFRYLNDEYKPCTIVKILEIFSVAALIISFTVIWYKELIG
jgi:hypothetical protein